MPWKNGNPPLYSVWRDMLCRCYNPKFHQFKDYGGRGIKVCPQWRHNYKQWYHDVAPRPPGLTFDRVDNDKDYTPENCRWATRKQQQRNQTVTRKVIIEGVEYIAADLADLANLKTDTIVERSARGLPYDKVMSPKRAINPPSEARMRAARKVGDMQMAKTHCKRGHLFSIENTYITKSGFRRCRKCHAIRQYSKNHP